MKLIKIKPVINSLRHANLLEKKLLIKNATVFKNLRKGIKRCNGRSTLFGRITSWHKQTGAKFLYRPISYSFAASKAIVLGVCYDPNRNALSALNFDLDKKEFFNDIHINNTYPGSLIQKFGCVNKLAAGYRVELRSLPTGAIISNITTTCKTKNKAVYSKSAGAYSVINSRMQNLMRITLPSGKKISLYSNNSANIGSISNRGHKHICLGKAGRNRNLGRRPIVRGIAMNPVDHPHGGRTNGGRPSVSPWGILTKNRFTLKSKSKKYNK